MGADAGQQLEQLVLAAIGILMLIDQQVAQAILPFLGNSRMLIEELDREADQVVEVHRLIGLQRCLVGEIRLRGPRFEFVRCASSGGFGGVTSAFFQLEMIACRWRSVPLSMVPAMSPDDAGAIGRIENRKRGFQPTARRPAQDAHAERVEGRNLHFLGRRPRRGACQPAPASPFAALLVKVMAATLRGSRPQSRTR